MAGRIPQHFIDDLINRTDIVDIIDERVPLKKAGRDYKACCPFHSEKTPSFTVSQSKQFYYCFGCGAKGTAIGFLMDYGHLEFIDAVKELAERAGVEIPYEGGHSPSYDYQPLYTLLEQAAVFYRNQLREHPQKQKAIDYLKNRELDGATVKNYGIGYAPPGWDNLLQHLGSDQKELMEKAGLLIENDQGRTYDRFRDRIMFPILDRRGRTIGFGGRVLGDDTPKYLNSPETPVFHKGKEIYGLTQARAPGAKLERILVVEGYMDVVALAQHGISNAVASLGTAATSDHIISLFKVCPEIIFCFDGDKAGRKAAWRALENCLPLIQDGRQALFMFLPENEDPDTMVRKLGKEGFLKLVSQATPLSNFLFDHIGETCNLSSVDGQARFIEQCRPLIEKLPAGAYRQLMTQRLSELSRLDVREVNQLMHPRTQISAFKKNPAKPYKKGQRPLSMVAQLITALIQHPEIATDIDEINSIQNSTLPGVNLLLELFNMIKNKPGISTAGIIESFRNTKTAEHLSTLAAVEDLGSFWTEPVAQFNDGIKRLNLKSSQSRYNALLAKSATQKLTDEETREFASLLKSMHGS